MSIARGQPVCLRTAARPDVSCFASDRWWYHNATGPLVTLEEATAMKRICRDRRLTPEEAAKYKAIREQVAAELPELISRHHQRVASLDQVHELLLQLEA